MNGTCDCGHGEEDHDDSGCILCRCQGYQPAPQRDDPEADEHPMVL